MPRPNKPRTIGASAAAAGRIAEFLERDDRSVAWLERQAAMPAQSLRRVLAGNRELRVDEAIELAHVMGTTVPELITP